MTILCIPAPGKTRRKHPGWEMIYDFELGHGDVNLLSCSLLIARQVGKP